MELEIENKKYVIDDYLTISKYMELVKLEGFINDPVKLLSAYTEIPESTIKKAKVDNIQFVLAAIQAEYLKHEKNKVYATFEFKGEKYGLQKTLHEINYGGWIDLEMALTEGIHKNVDTLMAILYRPLKWTMGDKYDIEEYDGETMKTRKEVFKDLPVDYWFGASNFFFLQGKSYLEIMRNSLDYKQKKMKTIQMWKQRWMKLKQVILFK